MSHILNLLGLYIVKSNIVTNFGEGVEVEFYDDRTVKYTEMEYNGTRSDVTCELEYMVRDCVGTFLSVIDH